MWSRKKRKKEKGESKNKSTRNKEDSLSNKQEPHPSGQSSSSPVSDKREGSNPPRGTRGYSTEPNKPLPPISSRNMSIKTQLSVPLPSAPLSVGILESLTSSLVETSGDNQQQQASLEMKQVIAKAQRSLINQLQQQLEGSSRQSLPTSIDNSNNDDIVSVGEGVLSGRHTQTFDYGNQSNKEFEKAADKQRNYYRQDWDM